MGAMFNFILAAIILISISFSYPTATSQITTFSDDSVLIDAGLVANDTIVKINGEDIKLAAELYDVKYAESNEIVIEYERDNTYHTVTLTDAIKEIGQVGIVFVMENDKGTTIIDSVFPGLSADKAGIKERDTIKSIDGTPVTSSTEIIEIVSINANKEVNFEVERDGEVLNILVTPTATRVFDLGIETTAIENTTFEFAIVKTLNSIEAVINSYIDIFRGKVSIDNVSSIVGIGNVVSKTEGIFEYLNMLAIISLAIGAANLLPILPLDGGKIVVVLIESVIRRKLPEKIEIILTYIGFGGLMLLTVIVIYKDIIRLI